MTFDVNTKRLKLPPKYNILKKQRTNHKRVQNFIGTKYIFHNKNRYTVLFFLCIIPVIIAKWLKDSSESARHKVVHEILIKFHRFLRVCWIFIFNIHKCEFC